MSEIEQIPTSHVVPGNNDRKRFDRQALEELAQSIAAHGLAQPITVRPAGERFEIVAGERRFRAVSRVLGWDAIPAIVRTDLDDEAASAIMLAENTGRQDLDPIEEANAYASRMKRFSWSVERVAGVAGVSADLVNRRLSLLKLIPDARMLVATGQFPLGHAEAIAVLDVNRQRIALRLFNESENMPLRVFRRITSQLYEEQAQEALWDLEQFWKAQIVEMRDVPRRGKRAVTGAPTRSDIPRPRIWDDCRTNEVIDRYIADLLEAGFEAEAAAIGNLYDALVHSNFLGVPESAQLVLR